MPLWCDQGLAGPSPGGELGRDTPRPTAAASEPTVGAQAARSLLGTSAGSRLQMREPRVRRSCALHSSRLPPYAARGADGPDGDVCITAIHRSPGSQPMSRRTPSKPGRSRIADDTAPASVLPAGTAAGSSRVPAAVEDRVRTRRGGLASSRPRPSPRGSGGRPARSSRAGTPVRPASHQRSAMPPCFRSCDARDES